MPIEIPMGDDGPIDENGSGSSVDSGNTGSAGGVTGPAGGTGNPGVVLPPVVVDIIEALAQPAMPVLIDIADLIGFGDDEPVGHPTDQQLEDAGVSQALIRAVTLAQQHEPELVDIVVCNAKSAREALHMLFADADDELSEEDAQRLLGGTDSDGGDHAARVRPIGAPIGPQSHVDIPTEEDIIAKLAEYGVSVEGDFTREQLLVILSSVETVGVQLADYTSDMTPQEAFKAVFEDTTFTKEGAGDQGKTEVPEECDSCAATISLPSEIFSLPEPTDARWLVIHELGHVFENRLGRTSTSEPAWVLQLVRIGEGEDAYEETRVLKYEDRWESEDLLGDNEHELFTVEVVGNWPVVTAPYLYHTGGSWNAFTGYYQAGERRIRIALARNGIVTLDWFLPNELGATGHPNPTEGFADSFAFFMLYGKDASEIPLLRELLRSESRVSFFDDNMQGWVDQLLTE